MLEKLEITTEFSSFSQPPYKYLLLYLCFLNSYKIFLFVVPKDKKLSLFPFLWGAVGILALVVVVVIIVVKRKSMYWYYIFNQIEY